MLGDSTTTTVVAASAIKAIGALAKGLGRDFLPYGKKLVPILLDDFKTKKSLVGAVIHDVLDDMHSSCFSISGTLQLSFFYLLIDYYYYYYYYYYLDRYDIC
jgi:hypothetical protein